MVVEGGSRAAAPKGSMTYAFTHMGIFSFFSFSSAPPLPQIPVSPLALRSPILFWIWETGGNNERFSTSWGLTLDQTALSLPTLYKYPANIKWVSVSVVWDVAWWRPNVGQMRSRQQKLTIIISMHRIFKISAIFAAYRDVLSLKDLIINEQMNKFFPPEDFCFPRASNAKLFLD